MQRMQIVIVTLA